MGFEGRTNGISYLSVFFRYPQMVYVLLKLLGMMKGKATPNFDRPGVEAQNTGSLPISPSLQPLSSAPFTEGPSTRTCRHQLCSSKHRLQSRASALCECWLELQTLRDYSRPT